MTESVTLPLRVGAQACQCATAVSFSCPHFLSTHSRALATLFHLLLHLLLQLLLLLPSLSDPPQHRLLLLIALCRMPSIQPPQPGGRRLRRGLAGIARAGCAWPQAPLSSER